MNSRGLDRTALFDFREFLALPFERGTEVNLQIYEKLPAGKKGLRVKRKRRERAKKEEAKGGKVLARVSQTEIRWPVAATGKTRNERSLRKIDLALVSR